MGVYTLRQSLGGAIIISLIILLFASPFFLGAMLWMLLSPIGFWQTSFMILVEIVFISVLYAVIIFIIALSE